MEQQLARKSEDSREAAVYLLVEPTGFKIGWSLDVFERAKLVTPDVIWDKSSAIFFRNSNSAVNCERALHRLFAQWRQAPRAGDGGTEFFHLECLTDVERFIREQQKLLGYERIEFGSDLRRKTEAERGLLLPSTSAEVVDRKPKRERISAEERAALRRQKLAQNAKENASMSEHILATLKSLQTEGCVIARHATEDNTFLFYLQNQEQRERLKRLLCVQISLDDGSSLRLSTNATIQSFPEEVTGFGGPPAKIEGVVGLRWTELPGEFTETRVFLQDLPRLSEKSSIEFCEALGRNRISWLKYVDLLVGIEPSGDQPTRTGQNIRSGRNNEVSLEAAGPGG